MSTDKVKDYLLSDPLCEITRKERRMLLAVSMIGISLIKAGLVPTKITALGIDFNETNQKAFMVIFLSIVIYFFFAFIFYAAADFLAWKRAIWAFRGLKVQDQLFDIKIPDIVDSITEMEVSSMIGETPKLSYFVKPVSVFRMAFDFILPIIVGIYSIGILILAI